MNNYGILMGLSVLVLTAIGHIAVIKGEYHFGVKIWVLFFVVGTAGIIVSFMVKNILLSGFLGILGFTSLWSISEVFKQKKRVARGWFPRKNNTL
ncbi:MAG: DUF4491 family protein [Clostridium sp.]|jgi:hypothetical protein|uniref:DUF4491 family protein n=1 Tax=Clostridium sp. TaxID=1506 RepID=UPI0025C60F88|nr:DUF4491 family protein [Clostridium sp.]MCH3965977.1 DUF4491 family protein [Clostridium sp.]MCI1715935.1 DUF4491 family protein [Clostridium sp.]MCI1800393.1 DUF4491 family protein [Clostridium sp.]MCI1814112.1 DUF4491 family protein [Clostridium sp.]MCI1871010.1 DUF4491 family protein [Clostridium sp.]